MEGIEKINKSMVCQIDAAVRAPTVTTAAARSRPVDNAHRLRPVGALLHSASASALLAGRLGCHHREVGRLERTDLHFPQQIDQGPIGAVLVPALKSTIGQIRHHGMRKIISSRVDQIVYTSSRINPDTWRSTADWVEDNRLS